jgi:hypothetical protein
MREVSADTLFFDPIVVVPERDMPSPSKPRLPAKRAPIAESTAKADSTTDSLGELTEAIPSADRAIIEYAKSKAENGEERIAKYAEDKAAFELALKTLTPEKREDLKHLLASSRFIDFAHVAPQVMSAFRSNGRVSLLDKRLHTLYDSEGGNAAAFKNMDRVNGFLKATVSPPCLERLLEVHRIAMRGSIDGIKRRAIGQIRCHAVVGSETERGLDRNQIRRLAKNPYLGFEPLDPHALPTSKDERVRGNILYPDAAYLKPEAASRLEAHSPKVYADYLAFCEKNPEERLNARDWQTAEFQTLTKAIIEALLNERYAAFALVRGSLKELKTPEEVLGYIKAVALHYRDVISIHPLGDGNGRTVRYESLYAPLDEVGISRPRLTDPDADILKAPSDWVRDVERGILSTDALYRDITTRLQLGLRLEDSPEFLFPSMSREVMLELRYRGKKKTTKNVSMYRIDGAEFGAYLDIRFSRDDELYRKFKKEPLPSLEALRDDFKLLVKANKAYCHIPGRGLELVEIALIDHDATRMFGLITSQDAERWKYKMGRFYRSNLIWRGLSSEDGPLKPSEVLSTFTRLGWLTLCNNLASQARQSHSRLTTAVQREFLRYNNDLIGGKLGQAAADHVGSGPGYDTSYGLSTSRRWSIAASFARGLGLLGYDKKEVLAAQDRLGDRLIVGAYQAKKDLDVRRFKFIDPTFSYKFGRQQEIVAIGGIDPDAVMTVQRVDAKLRIITSWVRNPGNPNLVYEIDGGFHPDDGNPAQLPKSKISKIHTLF